MKLINLLIFLIIILFSAAASAQFYKYVDENGNIHFTDDINEVPVEQRDNIRSYVESESDADIPEENRPHEQPQEDTQQANSTGLPDDTETESLENTRNRLEALKQDLDNEYQMLVKEKEKLAKDKEKAVTREQIIEYNKKVDSLNERVKMYDQKGKEYKTQVDAYNAKLSEENSKENNTETQ